MKELSIRSLELLAKKGGWKLSEDAQQAVNFGKTSRVLSKLIQAVEGLVRTIIALEKSFSRKVDADAKFDRKLVEALDKVSKLERTKVSKWTFTVKRDSKGLIKEVIARGE